MPEPKEGVVIAEGDKFFLELAGSRVELQPQMMGGVDNLKALAGQKVEILYSEPTRFVVGLQAGRRPPILCYYQHGPYWETTVGAEPVPQYHVVITDEAGIRRPIIVCYVPAPGLIKGVEYEVRRNLANQLLQEGYISADVHEKILGGRSTT
jgi:hypothetical protein